MSNTTPTNYDEIDLLSLLETIWDGKWIIVSIIVVFLLSVFGFNIVKPYKNFTAITEIKPISSFVFDKYRLFNSSLKIIEKENKDKDKDKDKDFQIFEITEKSLLKLYIEKIEDGSLLEKAIYKFNLVDKDDFSSDDEYREAVEKFASEIKVSKPSIRETKEKSSYHTFAAQYDNKQKWKTFLYFVNEEANKRVKNTIINRFETIIAVQQQKKDFAIKDLEIEINNLKKDYDIITNKELAFLSEQAAIARKLNIKDNTISSQQFNSQNTIVTNVKTDAPFYLRGYKAIEEKIFQIKNRKDKSLFIEGLHNLKKEKRKFEQDKTLQRAVSLFKKTPLNNNFFKATMVKVGATKFQTNKNNQKIAYALALVLGGIIGVIYVLISQAFKNRKTISTTYGR